jgi:Na+/phosphate symporter
MPQYALLPIAIGFFMFFAGKKERLKHYGMMIMGLGLVFYGMGIMSDGMSPLRNYEPFLELLKRMENPALGILAGAVFTGLVQSSAATVGIAIAMASEGLLSLPAGIIIEPKYLDNSVLKAPSLALERARFELGRAGEITEQMLKGWLSVVRKRDLRKLEEIAKREDQVDILEAAIIEYLSRIRQHLLTEQESNDHQALMIMTITLESIADVIEIDLTDLAKQSEVNLIC